MKKIVGISFFPDSMTCSIVDPCHEQKILALETFALKHFEIQNGCIRNLTTIKQIIYSFLKKYSIDDGYCIMSLDDAGIEQSLISVNETIDLQSFCKQGYQLTYEQWDMQFQQSSYYICRIPSPILFAYMHCALQLPIACLSMTTHATALVKGYQLLNQTIETIPKVSSFAEFYINLRAAIATSSPINSPEYVESLGLFNQGKTIYERSL